MACTGGVVKTKSDAAARSNAPDSRRDLDVGSTRRLVRRVHVHSKITEFDSMSRGNPGFSQAAVTEARDGLAMTLDHQAAVGAWSLVPQGGADSGERLNSRGSRRYQARGIHHHVSHDRP